MSPPRKANSVNHFIRQIDNSNRCFVTAAHCTAASQNAHQIDTNKAVLPQGNRAMPQLFFSV